MQQLCNRTAKWATNGSQQCAWCLRVSSINSTGDVVCPPDPVPSHGPLRGTVAQFTLISSTNGPEMKRLMAHFGQGCVRAIHMVRDPLWVTISDYEYNRFVQSAAGARYSWDANTNFSDSLPLSEQLRAQINATMRPHIKDLVSADEVGRVIPDVLTLDLADFEHNYSSSVAHLFDFMVGTGLQEMLARSGSNCGGGAGAVGRSAGIATHVWAIASWSFWALAARVFGTDIRKNDAHSLTRSSVCSNTSRRREEFLSDAEALNKRKVDVKKNDAIIVKSGAGSAAQRLELARAVSRLQREGDVDAKELLRISAKMGYSLPFEADES